MPRVKRGNVRRAKRKKLLARAKGFYANKSKLYRAAKESVDTALKYAFVGRRRKKRDFRRLWVVRINAAARENGLTYGQLISGLKAAGNPIDRKSLADLATSSPAAFARLAKMAAEAKPAPAAPARGPDRSQLRTGHTAFWPCRAVDESSSRFGRVGSPPAAAVRASGASASRRACGVGPHAHREDDGSCQSHRRPARAVRSRPGAGHLRVRTSRSTRPVSGAQGRARLEPAQSAGQRAARGAAEARSARQSPEAGHRGAIDRAALGNGAGASAEGGGRRHAARSCPGARPSPPADDSARAHRRHLHAHGVPRARGPRARRRLPQLRSAQHAAGASRARHAGHAVPCLAGQVSRRVAGDAAADAHVRHAGPLHEAVPAAGPADRAGPRVPARQLRPHPHTDVHAGRGPRRR